MTRRAQDEGALCPADKPLYCPGAGYWISPAGQAFRVATTHIAAVCAAPGVFGVSEAWLRARFANHGEAWASEGHAREKILVYLVQRAHWVRVRHYCRRHGYYTVNMPDFDAVVVQRVRAFFRLLLTSGAFDDNLRLDSPAGIWRTSIRQFLTDAAPGESVAPG